MMFVEKEEKRLVDFGTAMIGKGWTTITVYQCRFRVGVVRYSSSEGVCLAMLRSS